VITDSARARAVADALALAASPAGAGAGQNAEGSAIGERKAFQLIGQLLAEGHTSLRDDFEVSWPAADVTVESATAAGAYGAKMIGGGFGGSVLALVPAERLSSVRAAVTGAFTARGWAQPAFIDAVPSPSARRLS
jgi:galactokinase